MKNVSRSVARVEMPALSASGRFCTVARMRRPSEVNFRPAASAANAAIDSARMNSRDCGKANPRTSTGPDSHAGRGHVDAGGAEDVAGQLLQHQRDAPGHQQRVQRAVVHAAQQRRLEQHAEQAGDDEGDRQRHEQRQARRLPRTWLVT